MHIFREMMVIVGFQLYTGYYVDSPDQHGKATQAPGFVHGRMSGMCLEAQRFPDAIHQPEWRDMVVLQPGQVYRQQTMYEFL